MQEALLEATRKRNRSTLEECICVAQSYDVFQKYLDEAGHVLEELIHEEALAKAAVDADAA